MNFEDRNDRRGDMKLHLIGLIRSDILTYIPECSNCLSEQDGIKTGRVSETGPSKAMVMVDVV